MRIEFIVVTDRYEQIFTNVYFTKDPILQLGLSLKDEFIIALIHVSRIRRCMYFFV